MEKIEINKSTNIVFEKTGSIDSFERDIYSNAVIPFSQENDIVLEDGESNMVMELSFNKIDAGEEVVFDNLLEEKDIKYMVIKGSGKLIIDNEGVEITEGYYLIVKPKCSMTLKNNSDNEIVVMLLDENNL